jgi:hypothetical protein
VTKQAEPGRPPAHDLSAFDLSKRSPEQLAQSFARWKAQRKRPPEPARPTPLQARMDAASGVATAPDASPDEAPRSAPSKRGKLVEYSATFSALLAAGSEPTVSRAEPPAFLARPAPARSGSSGRRLKAMSVLAGAASVLALAVGALLELSDGAQPTEAKPEVAQIQTRQMPVTAPIAAAATKAPDVAWTLQRTVDLALMKAGTAQAATPPAELQTLQTASKVASSSAKPIAPKPTPQPAAPESAQFVAKPFIPSETAAPAPPLAVVIRSGDPRPDALFQLGRDKSTGGAAAVSDRAASGGKPPEATGAQGGVEVRSPSARTATPGAGKVANGGSADPRGEGSGGRVGPAVSRGTAGDGDAAPDAEDGGGDTGANDGGSADAGGDTGSADTGSSDAGSGDADSSDAGSGDGDSGASDSGASGSDDAGGSSDAGSGDDESGSTDGEDGNSGAMGGALGAVGDALGGALGGGKGNPDSNDKDQRN